MSFFLSFFLSLSAFPTYCYVANKTPRLPCQAAESGPAVSHRWRAVGNFNCPPPSPARCPHREASPGGSNFRLRLDATREADLPS